jgi:hypothetical protein
VRRRVGQRVRHRQRALRGVRDLEDAHRAVPDHGLRALHDLGELRPGRLADDRVRGRRQPPEAEQIPTPAEKPRQRCSPSWARLIAKVYEVDPLLCARCGNRMSIAAFVSDTVAIRRILDHLGLSTPEAQRPPPPPREVVRVAEHGEGWGVPADWE